jgi:hypothetical protein
MLKIAIATTGAVMEMGFAICYSRRDRAKRLRRQRVIFQRLWPSEFGTAPKRHNMKLPDIEAVAAKVHEAWMQAKRARGITTRKSEAGEELMVDYERLSEEAKELDRESVRAVYAAIQSLSREESR